MTPYFRGKKGNFLDIDMTANLQEKNGKMIDTVQKLYNKLMEQYVTYFEEKNDYTDANTNETSNTTTLALQHRIDFNAIVSEVAATIEKTTTEKSFSNRLTWEDIEKWMELDMKTNFHCFSAFKRLLTLGKNPRSIKPRIIKTVDTEDIEVFDFDDIATVAFDDLDKMSTENQEEQLEMLQILDPRCSKLLENFYAAIMCKLLLNGGLDSGLKRAIYFRYGILEKYKKFDLENIEDEPEMVCEKIEKELKIS